MITRRLILVALAPVVLNAEPANTVITPIYLPGLSSADSSGISTPARMGDNSGMSIPISPGVDLFEVLNEATHIADLNADESWLTNDAGADYFASNPDPVIVYDLEAVYEISQLYFWQFQGRGGAVPQIGKRGHGAKNVDVRFSLTAAPGSWSSLDSFILDPPVSTGRNVTQQRILADAVHARYVQLKVTDNFFGIEPTGGQRVGLGEFRVGVITNPAISVPAIYDVCATANPPPPFTFEIPVTNSALGPGGRDLRILKVQVIGPDAGLFQLGDWDPALQPGNRIRPGDTHDLEIDVDSLPAGDCKIGAAVWFQWEALPGGAKNLTEDAEELPDDDVIVRLSSLLSCFPDIGFEILGYPDSIVVGPFPKGVGPQPFTIGIANPDCYTEELSEMIFREGTCATCFAVAAPGDFLPRDLNSGDTVDVDCIFESPGGGHGLFRATLEASSDSSGWTGTAIVEAEILADPEVSPPPPVMASGAADLADIRIGIQIANTPSDPANDNLTVNRVVVLEGGDLFSVDAALPESIAEGDVGTIVLHLNAGDYGSYSATIRVETSDPDTSFELAIEVKIIEPLELGIVRLDESMVRVTVSNVNPGGGGDDDDVFHLKYSTDGLTFEVLEDVPPFSSDSICDIDVVHPAMLIRVYHGVP